MDGLTRREFLCRTAGVCGGAAACALGVGPKPAAAAAVATDPSKQLGVLVDVTRCIGCRACVRACDMRNNLPLTPHATTVWDGPAESLTFNQWTMVNLDSQQGGKPVPLKQQCMHCLDPACVSVCPVGAMQRLPSGAVVYRAERCIGCRYCMLACPFGIPKFEWRASTAPSIGKCQFCAQYAEFTGPACAAACPTGSLKFGAREQLLFEARARVHSRPDRYVDHIYGEHEAGGTAWLYLSGRPFSQISLPHVPQESLPGYTRKALEILPWVVTFLAVVLTALSYLVPGRRTEHEEA